jgi:integrase
MANIRKRPNGTYQATIYLGRDSNGKQLFEYITKDTYKECKMAASERELEIAEGKSATIANVRFSTWAEEWLTLNKKRLSPSTVALYKTYISAHYIPYFGNVKVGKITEILVRRFINEKLETLKSGTVRKLFFVLSKILQDALKDKNPCKYIKSPPKDDFTPYVLSDKEFDQIHSAFKGTEYEPIILLAGLCGLRRGEIFALKWDDIDWDNHIIRVDENRCINEAGDFVDKPPKSKNGLREVAVTEYIIKLLEKIRSEQKEIRTYIFPGRPDNFSSRWAELRANNKLPPIRFHDLRHYHASWLYAQNIPDQYAAERLGHDVQVLKTIYQHLHLEKRKKLDNKIVQLQKKNAR